MIIALDIDGTYSEDQTLWHRFIREAQSRGHEVIAVTMRYPEELNDDIALTLSNFVKIHCTSRTQKRAYMQNRGIFVAIWIDDMPEAIVGT